MYVCLSSSLYVYNVGMYLIITAKKKKKKGFFGKLKDVGKKVGKVAIKGTASVYLFQPLPS